MKQKKTMLIMVAVLAVLLVLYGGLKAWNSHSDRQKKAKEDKEKVSLVDVKSLKSFAYESGGSKMSFTKENGEWVYDEDDGVRLNQSTIKSTAKEITGLTAVRKLSDPDEKSDYGLDSPDYTVTYTAKDGTKGTIQIGNAAGDNYYRGFGCGVYHLRYTGIGSCIRPVISDGERHTAIDQQWKP